MAGRALLHMVRYFAGFDGAETQTTVAEREALCQLIENRRCAVEIGVFEGRTTFDLARALPADGLLYAVDPFFTGRLGVCWGEPIAKSQIAKSGKREQVVILKMLSSQAVDHVPGQPDFVFIDGDHSLEGIKTDWTIWSHKVTHGGVIALHDTALSGPNPRIKDFGSYQYFESNIKYDPRYRHIDTVDSMTVVIRT